MMGWDDNKVTLPVIWDNDFCLLVEIFKQSSVWSGTSKKNKLMTRWLLVLMQAVEYEVEKVTTTLSELNTALGSFHPIFLKGTTSRRKESEKLPFYFHCFLSGLDLTLQCLHFACVPFVVPVSFLSPSFPHSREISISTLWFFVKHVLCRRSPGSSKIYGSSFPTCLFCTASKSRCFMHFFLFLHLKESRRLYKLFNVKRVKLKTSVDL